MFDWKPNISGRFGRLSRFYKIAALIFVGICASCSDFGINTIDLSYGDQFPLRLGCYWKYAVHQIVSETDTSNYFLSEWTIGVVHLPDRDRWGIVYSSSDRSGNDTSYAEVGGDTVKVGYYQDRFHVLEEYALPMSPGKSWLLAGSWYPTLVVVQSQMSVDTKAGIFEKGLRIYWEWHTFFSVGYVDEWFVPGVGIVNSHDYDASEGPSYESTTDLIEYQIAR